MGWRQQGRAGLTPQESFIRTYIYLSELSIGGVLEKHQHWPSRPATSLFPLLIVQHHCPASNHHKQVFPPPNILVLSHFQYSLVMFWPGCWGGGLRESEKNQTHRHFRDDHVTSPLLKFTCLKASVQTTFTCVISRCCCGRNRNIVSHSHFGMNVFTLLQVVFISCYTHISSVIRHLQHEHSHMRAHKGILNYKICAQSHIQCL